MAKRTYDERIAHHPHDGLVKRILTNPEAAAAELRHVLSPALVEQLDWSTLRVDSPLRAIMLESASQETRQMYATIREQLIAEGKAEGMAEGMAQMLERLLDTRGLVLTEELRERLSQCRDEALLQRWFDRAVTAASLTEVFDD